MNKGATNMEKNLNAKRWAGLSVCMALIILLSGILSLSVAYAEEQKTIIATAEGYTGI